MSVAINPVAATRKQPCSVCRNHRRRRPIDRARLASKHIRKPMEPTSNPTHHQSVGSKSTKLSHSVRKNNSAKTATDSQGSTNRSVSPKKAPTAGASRKKMARRSFFMASKIVP